MLLIDLEQGRIVEDEEIKADLAGAAPYGEWLRDTQYKLEELPAADAPAKRSEDPAELRKAQQAFGFTDEDLKLSSRLWRRMAMIPSDRWATIYRSRSSPRAPSCSTILSTRTSRRSTTRRPNRSPKHS